MLQRCNITSTSEGQVNGCLDTRDTSYDLYAYNISVLPPYSRYFSIFLAVLYVSYRGVENETPPRLVDKYASALGASSVRKRCDVLVPVVCRTDFL